MTGFQNAYSHNLSTGQLHSVLINKSTTASENVNTARDGSNISCQSPGPAEAMERPPLSNSSNNEPQHGSFAPTIFDRVPDQGVSFRSVEDLPYTSYLESIQQTIPGVSDIVSLIGAKRSQIFGSEPRSTPYSYTTGEHIVVGEISAKDPNIVYWHDIDCANAHSLEQHSQILACTGAPEEVTMRYFLMDDISERAIEVLGQNLKIDASVFLKHLHQGLEGCPVENIYGVPHAATGYTVSALSTRTVNSPFAIREIFSHFRYDQTHMVICPTDMFVVPTNDRPARRVPIICSDFEERQLQRVPRSNTTFFHRDIVCELGRRSFMMPSICEDFEPYLPLWPTPGDEATEYYTPVQRVTIDRSDHVIIHIPGDTEIPTGMMSSTVCLGQLMKVPVLILRTASAWNRAIQASDLGSVHQALSDNREQWKVLRSPDYFQSSPVPGFADRYTPSLTSVSDGEANGRPPKPREFGSNSSQRVELNSNLALSKVLVDWHIRCTEKNVLLQKAATPAQIYFLERALSRLRTVTEEDYKRAYDQCGKDKLQIEEKRRLLDYCRTRATKWERLTLSNSRMLDEICRSICLESEAAQKSLKLCCEQIQCLVRLIEDQLHKTKEFVSLQLEHIAADQQRELMHNQIALSQVQIAESRKAIQQTETMRKLTILAFVFIPTSTICSFFGMNVKEMDQHPRIWVFFATLILVIALVLMIATADGLLNFLMRIFAAMPVRPRIGEPDVSQTRWWTAMLLYKVVHIPFALVWKAALATSRKWKLLLSQGGAYRTGYRDPDRLNDGETRNEATETTIYTQKGSLMSFRLERTLKGYQVRWREFWQTSAKRRQINAAFNWQVSNDPPDYVTGVGVRPRTEIHA